MATAPAPGRLHWLPCSIAHDGPAAVAHNFKPTPDGTEVHGLPVETAAFRGRRLVGAVFALPHGYRAYVVPQRVPPGTMADGLHAAWPATASYGEVTYWKLDEHPGLHDGPRRALDALAVAERVHAHVSAADVSAELAAAVACGHGGGDGSTGSGGGDGA